MINYSVLGVPIINTSYFPMIIIELSNYNSILMVYYGSRETEEEIGVMRNSVQVLGTFHDALSITNLVGKINEYLFIYRFSNNKNNIYFVLFVFSTVTPVVGYLGKVDLNTFNLSKREIDDGKSMFVIYFLLLYSNYPRNRISLISLTALVSPY